MDTVAGQYPDSARPAFERVRYISPGEMPEVIVGCLLEEGFDATVSTDAFGPALEVSSPVGQEQPLAIAWYGCDVQYPIDPLLTQPLSAAEIEYLYEYNVQTLLPCLASQGHELSAPSKQTYIETSGTENGWYPYAELMSLPAEELQTLGKIRPHNPPGFREVASG